MWNFRGRGWKGRFGEGKKKKKKNLEASAISLYIGEIALSPL